MSIIRGIHALRQLDRQSCVSIGNFDGVHRGHQRVLQTLREKARQTGLQSTVVTFNPMAREYFSPHRSARLQTMQQRCQTILSHAIDDVVEIAFDDEFRQLSADAFIEDILVEGLGAKYVCVGDDFRFGYQRAAGFDELKLAGHHFGFEVEAHSTVADAEGRISSGRIRELVAAGNFAAAELLLGRAYSIIGTVQQGQQLGRTIGFPTANIELDTDYFAVSGVYAVQCLCASGQFQGVANVGLRPTVDGESNRLEVHLFNYDGELYGETLEVIFVEAIRAEKKFDSLDQLKRQIDGDVLAAQGIFAERSNDKL